MSVRILVAYIRSADANRYLVTPHPWLLAAARKFVARAQTDAA